MYLVDLESSSRKKSIWMFGLLFALPADLRVWKQFQWMLNTGEIRNSFIQATLISAKSANSSQVLCCACSATGLGAAFTSSTVGLFSGPWGP